MSPFPPRLRIMSSLRRWSVLPTLMPDFVAAHSWYVAIYSIIIADLIKWEGPKDQLLICALLHDIDEIVTGEICYGIKDSIIDKNKYEEFSMRQMCKITPNLLMMQNKTTELKNISDEIKSIVHCADRLDALFYCAMEKAFGNGAMAKRLEKCNEILGAVWWKLPVKESFLLECTWHIIIKAIKDHSDPANYDVND